MSSRLFAQRPRWFVASALLAVILVAPAVSATAKSPVANPPRPGHEQLELFDALATGDIRASVIAADSTRLTLQIHNDTDRPLAIRLPAALGAKPVLAQFGMPPGGLPGLNPGGGGPGGGPGGGGGVSSQGLGFGLPGGGGGGPGGMPGGGGPFGGGPFGGGGGAGLRGGFFNVLPGKAVKKRFESVCLDHGKPDPNKRIAYELAKLSDLNTQQDLTVLLVKLSTKGVSQETAQLATWHLANKKTWSELAATPYTTANGRKLRRYATRDIQAAQNFVKRLKHARPAPSKTQPAQSLSASYSSR